MKKHIAIPFSFLLVVLCITGCAEKEEVQDNKNSVAGKKYIYTGEPFSDIEDNYAFTITINDDGTYSYCESLLSSYLGLGKWSVNDYVLTLSDDTGVEIINYFLIDGEDLVFIEENSTNFIYVKVKDGERFHGTIMDEEN